MVRGVLVVAAVWALLSVGSAQAVAVPWVNGDFELGPELSHQTWTHADSTTFEDADGDGDLEAKLNGCAAGDIQLARGLSKGPVPATSHVTFDLEQGGLTFYSFRMILASAGEPGAYANNLLNAAGPDVPTYDDAYWFDDQVLAWEYTPGEVLDVLDAGSYDFDPVDAIAFNIDGWDDMTAEERTQFLSTAVHASLVIYGCADPDAGATLDNFAWDVPTPL